MDEAKFRLGCLRVPLNASSGHPAPVYERSEHGSDIDEADSTQEFERKDYDPDKYCSCDQLRKDDEDESLFYSKLRNLKESNWKRLQGKVVLGELLYIKFNLFFFV